MIDQRKRTYHFETSSLLPLKLVLIEAEKESPPQVLRKQRDVNEELAFKLIASMKKNYRKAMSLRGALVATKQHLHLRQVQVSPPNLGIASGCCPRNDIQLEP
jgi:hypothetical protein